MAASKQTSTYTHTLPQCRHASVGLAQARPNYISYPYMVLIVNTAIHVQVFTVTSILENVEHCRGEPEQADTGYYVDEWCNTSRQSSSYMDIHLPGNDSLQQIQWVKDKLDILAWNAVSLPCTQSCSKAGTLVCWGPGCLSACLLHRLASRLRASQLALCPPVQLLFVHSCAHVVSLAWIA